MRSDLPHILARLLYSRAALVVSILLCSALFFQLVQVVSKSTSTGRDISSLKSEVDKLQSEQKRLEQLRSFLQTDFFAEQEARTKFGLQKEGERALIITDKEAREQNTRPDSQPASPVSGVGKEGSSARSGSDTNGEIKKYHLWWEFFFGIH